MSLMEDHPPWDGSKTKLAVRAEPDKLKACIVRLAVDQDEVGPDVAIAVIAPLAAERMIEIAARQRLILRQHADRFEQQRHRGACCAVPISPVCSRGESGWCI